MHQTYLYLAHIDDSGYNFSGIITPGKEQQYYSLSYEAFVVPLVKAVQEQQQLINEQRKEIADLKKEMEQIKMLLQKLNH